MGKIRIMADNACDLDLNVLQELGVEIFHMPVEIGNVCFRDRLDLNPELFYRLLNESNAFPRTSQINPLEFTARFQEIMHEGDDEIIYIAFSSGLSGTFQSACLAREEVNPERITVVDSLSASVGYGLTVVRAAEAAQAGKSKQLILDEIRDNIQRIQHIFMVGDYEMLKRGGRISATAAAIGNLLNIRLILHFVEGKIVPLEKVHGLNKAHKHMLNIMEERGYELKDQLIGINYSVDKQGALELKDSIEQRFGCQRFIISEIGAAIGSHVGAGTHSVFFLGPKQ